MSRRFGPMLTTIYPISIYIARLEGQLEAICPQLKHLKHFLLDDFCGDLGLELEVKGLDSLGLKVESLEGIFEKELFLFFQEGW